MNSEKSNFYKAIIILSIAIICLSSYLIYKKIKKEDNFKITKKLKERFKLSDQAIILTYEDLIKAENNYKTDLKTEGDAYNSSKSIADSKFTKLTSDHSSINELISKIIKSQDSLTADVKAFDIMITTPSNIATDLFETSKKLQDKAKIILDDVNSTLSQINPLQQFALEAKSAADDTMVKANAYSSTVSEGSEILRAFNSLQQYKDTDTSVKGATIVIGDAQKALDDNKVEKDDIPIIEHGIQKVSTTITKITDILDNITNKLRVDQSVKDTAARQVENVNTIIVDISDKIKILNDFKIKASENLTLINARIYDLQLSTNIFNSNVDIDKNYAELNKFYTDLRST